MQSFCMKRAWNRGRVPRPLLVVNFWVLEMKDWSQIIGGHQLCQILWGWICAKVEKYLHLNNMIVERRVSIPLKLRYPRMRILISSTPTRHLFQLSHDPSIVRLFLEIRLLEVLRCLIASLTTHMLTSLTRPLVRLLIKFSLSLYLQIIIIPLCSSSVLAKRSFFLLLIFWWIFLVFVCLFFLAAMFVRFALVYWFSWCHSGRHSGSFDGASLSSSSTGLDGSLDSNPLLLVSTPTETSTNKTCTCFFEKRHPVFFL